MNHSLSIGQCATLACLMEVSAPKPGNVHRGADFEDVGFFDFAASAAAIGPAMQRAATQSLGETIYAAIQATRQVVRTNTNLGTVLLLAPLATVPLGRTLKQGVASVLQSLDADDARQVYAAIRLAQPGGMGRVSEADVSGDAPTNLLVAMRSAADRDLVARQYAEAFKHVLDHALPWFREELTRDEGLCAAIIRLHLRLMSEFPDSLIARKCGLPVAQQAATRAALVLDAAGGGEENYHRALADLDFWLRSDHHRRNPGTTADMVAATLYAALREGVIEMPLGW